MLREAFQKALGREVIGAPRLWHEVNSVTSLFEQYVNGGQEETKTVSDW